MYVCESCSKALKRSHSSVEETNHQSCAVCLGLFQDPDGGGEDLLANRIRQAIERALEPYGPPIDNCWSVSNNSCTLHPPGDVIFRFLLAKNDGGTAAASAVVDFAEVVKQRSKDLMQQSLSGLETQQPTTTADNGSSDECGRLGLYVQLTPSPGVPRPPHLLSNASVLARKRKRRHHDHVQQGGDPRNNLQLRLAAQGTMTWTINQALTQTAQPCQADILERPLPVTALDVHCVVWRLPFYIRGTYTKNRRDVSQTPFFITKNGERIRLGITSVEEQIVPMVRRGCGNVSSFNDDPSSGGRVFGAVKFHASGREDMDVRMLLPSSHQSTAKNATGRPFVCEVIDAFRVPTAADLHAMREEINRTTANNPTCDDDCITVESDIRYYGQSPMGVGVSSLSLVPPSAYKNLQSETEHKVKYYGCLCWSQTCLPETLELIQEQLSTYPLSLAQKTPLRVLHRRALAIRQRQILSCHVVHRVDNHHFRLVLSTEAGTYVKEFVHGDLGRTIPSVASLLQCKTDILELDCEGVEVSDDKAVETPMSQDSPP